MKHLTFKELEPNKKTKRFLVETGMYVPLGEIKWKDPWTRYGIYTNPEVVLGAVYLKEITEFIDELNKE